MNKYTNIDLRDIAVITILLLASIVSTGFIVIRYAMVGPATHHFLVWNLFLAWIPLGTAFLLKLLRKPPLALLIVGSLVWLLFLPNAPYILTDLIHLRWSRSLIWLDWSIIVSFALTGLFVGFASLSWMQAMFRQRWGAIASWVLVLIAMGASGFGVYIGRFMRLNSWDMLTRPQVLVASIYNQLFSPETYLHTWLLSLTFGMLFTFTYCTIQLIAMPSRPITLQSNASYGD